MVITKQCPTESFSVAINTAVPRKKNFEYVRNYPPDTEIVCDDGTKINVHRVPLSTASEYFRAAYFTFGAAHGPGTIRNTLSVPMLKANQLQMAVDFAYSGECELTFDNIQDVVETADFLGMDALIEACHRFMKENSQGPNVISLWRLATLYMMNEVANKLHHRILEDFEQLAEADEVLDMTLEEFSGFVNHDQLNISDEAKLWSICLRWIEHDLKDRQRHLFPLLKAIRVYLLEENQLRKMLTSSSLLTEDPQCSSYMISVGRAMYTKAAVKAELSGELEKTSIPREPHGVILLLGGWLQAPSNVFEVYDPCADRHTLFPQFADVEEMRAYHKMAIVDGDVFVVGGFHGDINYHKHCRKYNLATKSWSHVTPMNVERCYVSVAVVGRKIYAIGGYNGRFRLNTAEALDLDSNQWSFIRPMEYQRSDAACTVLNGMIYAIGGFTGRRCIRTVERYNPKTDTWAAVAPMSSLRSGVSAVTLRGKIYALGGSTSGNGRLRSCEVYDPVRDSWSPIASMLTARSNFAAVVCEDLIYVFGGYTGEETTRLCECYNSTSDEWFVVTDMNHARSALAALFVPCFDGIRELTYPNRKGILQEGQRPPPSPSPPACPSNPRQLQATSGASTTPITSATRTTTAVTPAAPTTTLLANTNSSRRSFTLQ
ncbi:kelch-like protein 10 [Varroa jacobsoni]|uniref:kelch-like protein 10 n=1 Tax=Varroa jacobsoni TaxID=62625 RepID=UPI000BF2E18A|nr:kelch-like protein 10 [Varroa jacobsoni]